MRMVTTYDGRQVDSRSEEWRAHCEATTLLSWPLAKRRIHMNAVLVKRKHEAHLALSELISTIWKHRQANRLQSMDDDERDVLLGQIERATNARMRSDIEMILMGRLAA